MSRIDRLFDSFEKRQAWFQLLILFYWLWQFIWLALFLVQVFSIGDYNSLFQLLLKTDEYSSCLLIRVAMVWIAHSTSIVSVLQSFAGIDIFCVIGTILLCCSTSIKKWWFLFLMALVLISIVFLSIIMGLQAQSLNQVIAVLKGMAHVSICIVIIEILFILIIIAKKVLNISKLF